MKLAANLIYIIAGLAVCLWLFTRPLLKLAAGLAIILAPVAVPELILHWLAA